MFTIMVLIITIRNYMGIALFVKYLPIGPWLERNPA